MDGQAALALERLRALAPANSSDADDENWLTGFRCQTALLREFSGAAVPLASVSIRTVHGIPLRMYCPTEEPSPILFHIHGGGGVAGSLDIHDPALRLLARRTGWRVAAPDYRLAPKHRFPTQLEDCYAALLGVAEEATRIVVSGDSIGGTIATALAMLARERDGPAIAGQVLLYPNTDLRRDVAYPSRSSEDGNIIALKDLERQIDLYLSSEQDRHDPLASPILANVAGLPPTFLATAECDPLRDEGKAFYERLSGAGVSVTHHCYPGMIHAFMQMAGIITDSEELLDDIRSWLKAA
jgi:acetyl esterase